MLKLAVFAAFLLASPALGLLETLFRSHADCYSGCATTYPTTKVDVIACRAGCDYKLHKENCADQCKLFSVEEQTQASCLVGCSMNKAPRKEHPQSITVIRIRPLEEVSSEHTRQNHLSIVEKIKQIFELTKNLRTNSEKHDQPKPVTPLTIPHWAHVETSTNRLQQYVRNAQDQWNDLVHKEAKTATWLLFGVVLFSSILLWYMIVSLCRRRPSHQLLSIRAQELHADNAYHNEKIQPYEHYYDAAQSAPLKVKLVHI